MVARVQGSMSGLILNELCDNLLAVSVLRAVLNVFKMHKDCEPSYFDVPAHIMDELSTVVGLKVQLIAPLILFC